MKNAKKKKEKVYGVFDHSTLIGYHDEKRVVRTYCRSFPKKSYRIKKISEKELKLHPNYPDLYFIRFGKTFIQSGYESYAREDYQVHLQELYLCKDVLIKLYELGDIEETEKSALKKVLNVLEESIQAQETEVPSMEELKQIAEQLDMFRYHISDLEHDDYRWNH